jgi:hypothetical protein
MYRHDVGFSTMSEVHTTITFPTLPPFQYTSPSPNQFHHIRKWPRNSVNDHGDTPTLTLPISIGSSSAPGQVQESAACCSSASKSPTTSSTDMRFEGLVCQHRPTIYQILSEISWWFGRDGLAPFSIEHVAAISDISENRGRPVRTCLE